MSGILFYTVKISTFLLNDLYNWHLSRWFIKQKT